MQFTVLLYYKYIRVPDARAEMVAQRSLCEELGLKGRILLGDEGINGTIAGSEEATASYIKAMDRHAYFGEIAYKKDMVSQNPFKRLRIKVRPEIVTLGVSVDPLNSAPKLSPAEFNELAAKPGVVLFDARNNYESSIGKFRNALTPDIELFKDLPAALNGY